MKGGGHGTEETVVQENGGRGRVKNPEGEMHRVRRSAGANSGVVAHGWEEGGEHNADAAARRSGRAGWCKDGQPDPVAYEVSLPSTGTICQLCPSLARLSLLHLQAEIDRCIRPT